MILDLNNYGKNEIAKFHRDMAGQPEVVRRFVAKKRFSDCPDELVRLTKKQVRMYICDINPRTDEEHTLEESEAVLALINATINAALGFDAL